MQAEARLDGRGGQGGNGALPGDSGLWVFILADMSAFALFFLLFTLGRAADPLLYEQSRAHLSIDLGLLNTIILLTSSWMMVQAVHCARLGDRGRTIRYLILTMLVGSGFAVTKIIEYVTKVQSGITMLTNDFFMYYFTFTGIHFLHFIVGMGALSVTLAKAFSHPADARWRRWMESVGCYWHMVDLLWIMLFPLLYLQRAA